MWELMSRMTCMSYVLFLIILHYQLREKCSWTWTLIDGSQLRGVGGGGAGADQICLSFFHSPHSHVVCFDKMCFALLLFLLFVARFSKALFSALEQTHCARMWFYTSGQLFIVRFWISTEVEYFHRWHGCCHMKLLPSRRAFCVHHTTMHRVTSCKATYVVCMHI